MTIQVVNANALNEVLAEWQARAEYLQPLVADKYSWDDESDYQSTKTELYTMKTCIAQLRHAIKSNVGEVEI